MLLAGLFAMHGLGPNPFPEPHRAASGTHAVNAGAGTYAEAPGRAHHSSSHPGRHAGAVRHAGHGDVRTGTPGLTGEHELPGGQRQSGDRGHDSGDCAGSDGGGCHVSHADATCAASGTSGGPVIALPAVCTPSGARSAAVPGETEKATPGVRAPPSLHQLQLLRI